ncbi:MAG: nucleoside triphosphate pyrophosphohydrolase [Bacteroidales bacterium]|nr:nucleoside triphosphate pyrophosphohydrolase [Bacteroidales bacterium]
MHSRESKTEAFGQLLDVMDTLREQCPWDRKQTFESLRPLTIEETYELSQALEDRQYDEVCKELGDLIMHIVFYAKVAEQQQLFDIQDVLEKICEKLKFRHPHIYGDVQVKTADDVSDNWEKLKLKEKDGNRTVLAGVPKALPSMIKALRMQDKAHGVGFDWARAEDSWDKFFEEVDEVKAEIAAVEQARQELDGAPASETASAPTAAAAGLAAARDRLEAEFGDLFFALVNVARLYKVNPDNALERTNQKFRRRFDYLEAHTLRCGRQLKDLTLEEMDALWDEAKKQEH